MYTPEWSADDEPSASSIQSTLWSVILRTRDPKDPQRIAGLVRLTSTYSMALYVYCRRNGASLPESEKSVRGFLDHVMAGNLGRGHDAHRDRLRSFLLSAFQEYLGIQSMSEAKSGRGSGARPKPMNFSTAEAWYKKVADTPVAPDTTYHRAWARCILTQSYSLLKEELAAKHGALAAEMITAEVSPLERRPFNPELAPKLSLTPSEVLEILQSSRRRMRELIFTTIRETVSSTPDVEVEFWDLFRSV